MTLDLNCCSLTLRGGHGAKTILIFLVLRTVTRV